MTPRSESHYHQLCAQMIDSLNSALLERHISGLNGKHKQWDLLILESWHALRSISSVKLIWKNSRGLWFQHIQRISAPRNKISFDLCLPHPINLSHCPAFQAFLITYYRLTHFLIILSFSSIELKRPRGQPFCFVLFFCLSLHPQA